MDILLFLRAGAALIFTLSLIGGVALLAKRLNVTGPRRPGKQMQILETCTIDPRHKIILVRIGEATRAALIGPNSCQFLNEEIELAEDAALDAGIAATPLAQKIGARAPAPAADNIIGWQAALQAMAQGDKR